MFAILDKLNKISSQMISKVGLVSPASETSRRPSKGGLPRFSSKSFTFQVGTGIVYLTTRRTV